MVRNHLNFGLVINMVIIHLNVLKEREILEKNLSLEEITIKIVYMLIRMKNLRKKIKVKVMMNWDLWLSRKMILIEKLEKREL